MHPAFALESKRLAEELHALLLALDPIAWKDEFEAAVRERVDRIKGRLKAALSSEAPAEHPRWERLRQGLHDVAHLLEHVPSLQASAATLQQEWQAFRRRAYPVYDTLAASLRHADIHLPVLRPTNYYRSAFHVLSGLVALVCIQHLVSPTGLVWIAVAFAGYAWTMETGRRLSPALNRMLMTFYGRVAHQHEHRRVNSATWYATALLILALFGSPLAASLAVVVLALGDPVAGLIGRRFGRIKIWAGRSLEGSVAFAIAGGLAALGVLLFYYPRLGLGASLAFAVVAALSGSLAELFTRWTDDNFTIPLAVGASVSLTALVLG